MATGPFLSRNEAATALYIDFESLGNGVERPAILGVLVIDTREARFEQYVLDDRLGEGLVARKGVCSNATPERAIRRSWSKQSANLDLSSLGAHTSARSCVPPVVGL
jgi:hypothetical protein